MISSNFCVMLLSLLARERDLMLNFLKLQQLNINYLCHISYVT